MEKQILESGLIHQPLPLNTENSFETNGWKKEILQSVPLVSSGSLKLQIPTITGIRAVGSPSDPDYATYGIGSVSYYLNGANLVKYNRIAFTIYPNYYSTHVIKLNLTF